MRYRAILFDLDDTLIPEAPAIVAGFAAVAERVWGAVTDERVAALRAAADAAWVAAPVPDYLERIHVDAADGLHGCFGGEGDEAAAIRAFIPAFHADAFEAALPGHAAGASSDLVDVWRAARIASLTTYPETVEVLEALRTKVPLALVTNGPSSLQRLKVAQTGLTAYFDVIVAAEDIGVAKPRPEMFDEARRGLGLGAPEVVMVGNDAARDVAGARAAGIEAVWVNRGGVVSDASAITDLRELAGVLA